MVAASTAAYVAAAAAAASGAVSAYSAIQQGQAQEKAEEYNAEVAANNAQQARDAAAVQEADNARRASQLLGTQRMAAAASGVDPNQGSPLAIMTDTAQQTTLDALKIRYGGATQSTAYTNAAILDRYQGRQAAAAGYLGAASTLLSGIGRGASLYGAAYSGAGGGSGGAGYQVSSPMGINEPFGGP